MTPAREEEYSDAQGAAVKITAISCAASLQLFVAAIRESDDTPSYGTPDSAGESPSSLCIRYYSRDE